MLCGLNEGRPPVFDLPCWAWGRTSIMPRSFRGMRLMLKFTTVRPSSYRSAEANMMKSPSFRASLSVKMPRSSTRTLDADGQVVFGATVELEDLESGDKACYQIVGDEEADVKAGKISVSSPIARALIGKYAGDVVQVQTPGYARVRDPWTCATSRLAAPPLAGRRWRAALAAVRASMSARSRAARGEGLGRFCMRCGAVGFSAAARGVASGLGRHSTSRLPMCCTGAQSSRSQISAMSASRTSRSGRPPMLMSSCAVSARSISASTASVRPLLAMMTTGLR